MKIWDRLRRKRNKAMEGFYNEYDDGDSYESDTKYEYEYEYSHDGDRNWSQIIVMGSIALVIAGCICCVGGGLVGYRIV